jgi:hypothetical protein
MIDMGVSDLRSQVAQAGGNGKDTTAMSTKSVVQVTWLDAAHQEDDIEEKDIPGFQPVRMVSFGLLMADDEEKITISGHVATDSSRAGDTQVDYRDTLVIPRQSVVSIDMLGELDVGMRKG